MAERASFVPMHQHEAFNSNKAVGSVVLSFFLCFSIALAFVISSEAFLHWFIIPVTLAGTSIGADALDWLRRRLDVFDPIGLLGLYGIHFFFLSPLLHVAWNYQMLYRPPLDDWRPWLGYMAVLNIGGLLLYRFSRGLLKPTNHVSNLPGWQLDNKLLVIVLYAALIVTGGLQILFYVQSGGIEGYIRIFESSLTSPAAGFRGYGALFAISESFPLLVMIGYAVYTRNRRWAKSWLLIFLTLSVFFVLRLLFGGLRGSRSNTIFALVWALGVVHLYVRPISRKVIFAGIIFSLVFMYVFGFFKGVGSDFLVVFRDPGTITQLESESNRTFRDTILGDLSRASVQAYLLHQLMSPGANYVYGGGITYLGGILTPIPDVLFVNPFPTKSQFGTEAMFGQGSYNPGTLEASNVYGLAGEAMLNFGPLAIPFAFIPLGLFTALVRNWLLAWSGSDARKLLLPFLVTFCLLLLTSDSDNDAVFLVKDGMVPLVVLWLSSRRKEVAVHA